jgi:hypothetical protein
MHTCKVDPRIALVSENLGDEVPSPSRIRTGAVQIITVVLISTNVSACREGGHLQLKGDPHAIKSWI